MFDTQSCNEPELLLRQNCRRNFLLQCLGISAAGLFATTASADGETGPRLAFSVALDPAVASEPLAGRLFVFLSQSKQREPRFGPDWFRPEPFCGGDVREFTPAMAREIDDRADCFPTPLSKLPPAVYQVQALLDVNLDAQNHAVGEGNLFSDVVELDWRNPQTRTMDLRLTHAVGPRAFAETEWRREIQLKSDLLSKFHNRAVVEKAAVVLPASYQKQLERRYPAMYIIPGFGGSHRDCLGLTAPPVAAAGEEEFIRVYLSGNCKWGHHVYADSATNGPRGAALIQEMIPHVDVSFRTVNKSTARFVTGHSSGGWSSLWLQVNYPDVFGGVWSYAPDPVDFRDWQQVDLYSPEPLSLYRDPSGARRPIARRGTQPVLWYDAFAQMDDVLGRGGQLRSFEAVFSPLGGDGQPLKMWNRQTGEVDPQIARAWQKYDIRLLLERNWPQLSEKLRGKLHIATGSLDTFYLEGAVVRLAESLRELGSDAEITILPGKDHGGVLSAELLSRGRQQMSEVYRRGEAAQ